MGDYFSYEARTLKREGRRQIADDLMVPERFTVEVRPEDEPWAVEVEVRISESGQQEPWRLTITSRDNDMPVSAALIRSVRLGDVVRAATSTVSERIVAEPDGTVRLAPMTGLDASRAATLTRSRPQGRTATVSDDDLQRVAKVWKANPGRPTLAVEEEFTVSRSTAVRLIRRARERGYLPPKGTA